MQPTQNQIEEISQQLRLGRKIQAIKIYRQATGFGLKDSKDFIDQLETALRTEDPDSFKFQTPNGMAGAVLLMIFAIALATLIGGILVLVG